MNKQKAEINFDDFFSSSEKITNAIQAGINEALLRHKQANKPICYWENGKVVWVEAENIKINK